MIAKEIAKLPVMTLPQLQELWQKYFDAPATSQNKDFYISRIAYRMQELQYGGLGTATKMLLINMYQKKEENQKSNALPPVGTRLLKTYHGQEHVVTILRDGFDYNGMTYKTLSSIASRITGQKVSGKFFFGLSKTEF